MIRPGLDLRDATIQEHAATIELLRTQLANTEQQRAEAVERCGALAGELQQARQATEALSSAQARAEHLCAETQDAFEHEREERSRAERTMRHAEDRRQAAELAQERMREELAFQRQLVDSFRKDRTGYQARIKQLDQQVRMLEDRLNGQCGANAELVTQLQTLRSQITACESRAEGAELRRQSTQRTADLAIQRLAEVQTAAEETRAIAAARKDECRARDKRLQEELVELRRELWDWQRAYRELTRV